MSRMFPTDEEISAVGVKLGHGPGPYPTKLKAQIVKTLQLSTQATEDFYKTAGSDDAFVDRVTGLYGKLKAADLPFPAAKAVVAAVAPALYRESRESKTD